MKLEALVTAAFLTITLVGLVAPVKADPAIAPTPDRSSGQVIAASTLEQPAAANLQFTTYDPYPFGSVEGVVMLSRKHGIGCLVSDREAQEGTVVCGLIDND